MSAGTAFVAEIPDGPTAIVLLGRGRMRFAPPDAGRSARRSGSSPAPTICVSEFDAAFVRVRPSEFRVEVPRRVARRRAPVVATDLRRATEVFDEYISRTLQIDLTDLSRDRWSLIPSSGDLIAEVRTRRFGSLTYARSGNEAEDITVFDRRRRRNISIYASAEKLATRGRFYSEDDLVDYDVLAYEIDAVVLAGTLLDQRHGAHARQGPRRGDDDDDAEAGGGAHRARRLRAGLRAPAPPARRQPEQPDRQSADAGVPRQRVRADDRLQRPARAERARSRGDRRPADCSSRNASRVTIPLEPRYIYSNNSFWYPQSTVSDYALGTLRMTVPNEYDVVATGALDRTGDDR